MDTYGCFAFEECPEHCWDNQPTNWSLNATYTGFSKKSKANDDASVKIGVFFSWYNLHHNHQEG